MDKSKNELIAKRRKKIIIKRTIYSILLLSAILITLCLKLPCFGVSQVIVLNNKTISTDEIIKEASIVKNTNIFYLNVRKIKENLIKNPYILSAEVKRKLPGSIEIIVNERAAAFYSERNKKYIIIDKNGVVLEERDNINNMKLINLTGFDASKAKIGNVIPNAGTRKLNFINNITDIVLNNSDCKNFTKVDITSELSFQVYYNDMCIKLGTEDDLTEKLNRAVNIIKEKNLLSSKGYVDVSFDGNPVYFVQK